jgi:hypothetical protein
MHFLFLTDKKIPLNEQDFFNPAYRQAGPMEAASFFVLEKTLRIAQGDKTKKL